MNQFAILLIAWGVVIAGCSEWGDNTDAVPTLHLVLDSEESSVSPHSSCIGMNRSVKIECHVQSDRPVEHDTYVLIHVKEGKVRKVGEVEDFDCTRWGRCDRLKFVTILAGETQSKKLLLTVREHDLHSRNVPKVVIELPPEHTRATLLPRTIIYTSARGQSVEKELLVEYPFNPYKIGSTSEVRVEWQGDEVINGSHRGTELSDLHEFLTRWKTLYQSEDIDAYMSVFYAGFTYEADMGTPNNSNDDVKWGYWDERESALRVFSLYQNIQIELDNPPKVKLNESRTRAEVRTHYRITAFVAEGVSLAGGRDGWYAEGEFVFVLERMLNRSGCRWKITHWFDKAINTRSIDKVATQFVEAKRQ